MSLILVVVCGLGPVDLIHHVLGVFGSIHLEHHRDLLFFYRLQFDLYEQESSVFVRFVRNPSDEFCPPLHHPPTPYPVHLPVTDR